MEEILGYVQLIDDVTSISLIIGTNEKAIKQIAKDVIEFFQHAMDLFGCSRDLIRHIEEHKCKFLAFKAEKRSDHGSRGV